MRNYQFTLSENRNGNDRSMGRPGREEQLGSAEGRARAAWGRASGSGGRARGLRHSDLSIRNNDWRFSQFPAVLGHEAVGRVAEVGRAAKGLTVGQRVGV